MLDLMGSVLAEAGTEITQSGINIDSAAFMSFGAVMACGIIIVGAAMGISKIANGATEAIARQPEAGGRIFTSMLLAAALIEGVTFFALIICMLSRG